MAHFCQPSQGVEKRFGGGQRSLSTWETQGAFLEELAFETTQEDTRRFGSRIWDGSSMLLQVKVLAYDEFFFFFFLTYKGVLGFFRVSEISGLA